MTESQRRAEGATSSARRNSAPRLIAKILAWLLLLAFLGAFAYGMVGLHRLRTRFMQLDFKPPGQPGPETWVIVGVDDRQYLNDAIDKSNDEGARADAIIVVTKTSRGLEANTLSRDMVIDTGKGYPNRLTMFWLDSPQTFTDGVCNGLGIPIDHLIRFDFKSVGEAVDAVGGVDVTSPYPLKQNLANQPWVDVPAGTTHLDGEHALRFVRSRGGQAYIGGKWIPEPNAPVKRQERIAQVFRLIMQKLKHDPKTAPDLLWRIAPDIGLDNGATYSDLLPLANMPTTLGSVPGQAATDVVVMPTDQTKKYIAGLGYTGCHL